MAAGCLCEREKTAITRVFVLLPVSEQKNLKNRAFGRSSVKMRAEHSGVCYNSRLGKLKQENRKFHETSLSVLFHKTRRGEGERKNK